MLLFRKTLDYESDRGCALTAGVYIDQKLKTLLLANFFDSPKARTSSTSINHWEPSLQG
jgi:hypothetical protein